MTESKRKKTAILIVQIIVQIFLITVCNAKSFIPDDFLLNKLNFQLPNIRANLAYSSVLSSDYVIATASGTPQAPIKSINNIAYYDGYLFIAAENWLLKLNAQTFEIEQSVQYGPLYDSVWCRYFPVEECSRDNTVGSSKVLTNNFNKLLLIYEKRQAILTCWSARQGTCELRDMNNLENLIQASSIPSVANDQFNSTIGFIASAANSQDLLYVAATYNDQGPYRRDVPALAGRSLSTRSSSFSTQRFSSSQRRFMEVLSSSQGLKSSKASIEFISRFQKNFIVKYIEAFNLGIYNYFLTVQHMDTTKSHPSNNLLVTKLARLCLNDLSFTKSYTEIPLKCSGSGMQRSSSYSMLEYNELVNARLVKVKSWANKFNDDNYYLVGLFQESSRTTFNSSLNENPDHSPIRQAVCMFSMREIHEAIKQNLNSCYNNYNNENIMRGLSFIKPDQRCSSKSSNKRIFNRQNSASSSSVGDDFCSTADNGIYPIGGRLPAISKASIEFDTEVLPEFFDSLQVWSDSTATSLILLSNHLQKLQFYYIKSLTQLEPYRTFHLNTKTSDITKPLTNLQFEKNGKQSPPNLFLASNNVIYKVKMTECDLFKTCGECLISGGSSNRMGDPYCGWCSSTNQCTTRQECSIDSNGNNLNSTLNWLNGAELIKTANNADKLNLFKSMCIDVKSIDPAFTTLTSQTEWIQVNFRKNLPPAGRQNASDYQCVFIDGIGRRLKTDAFKITGNKLKCSVPHYSQLRQMFDSNSKYIDQNLTIGEDGIFKVTRDYYYEEVRDRIVLPLYVQSTQNNHIRYGTISSKNSTETSFNLTIVDCSVRRSCMSCSSSDGQCSWCNNQCISTHNIEDTKNTCVGDEAFCPSFDTGTSKLLIPFTINRKQAPLTIKFLNQDVQILKLSCMLTIFDGKFIGMNVSLPFMALNATHGQCILSNVFQKLDTLISNTGQIQSNLRIHSTKQDLFIDSIQNGGLALMFYKCEVKANDCGQCLSLSRQFSCMWCNKGDAFFNKVSKFGSDENQQSTCRFMNSQSKQAAAAQCISAVSTFFSSLHDKNSKIGFNQCDKPQIKKIYPKKLPIGGGTILEITGVNLGSSITDLDSVSIQCGSANTGEYSGAKYKSQSETLSSETICDLIPDKYVPSKRIICKTRPSTSGVQRNCKLSLKLKSRLIFDKSTNSADNNLMNILISNNEVLEYVDPIITDIQPGTIIQSANFVWLTIIGKDLNAGRVRDIEIIDYLNDGSNSYQQLIGTGMRIIKCSIKNATSSEIMCRLNDKFRTLGKKDLKITFDNYQSIMHYLSLRVTTDPLVSSIDQKITIYSGGTRFKLQGYNFNAVQSAYTYLVFRDMWYSAPLIAKSRISNEVIEFEFPPLTEAFFDMINSESKRSNSNGGMYTTKALTTSSSFSTSLENYELQIGFLMDGFNVTLKNVPVTYIPDFTKDLISIENVDIAMRKNYEISKSQFSLIISLKIDPLIKYNDLLKNDLSVYIACSKCFDLKWINDSHISCQLPQVSANLTTIQSCPSKVFRTTLKNLDMNVLRLVNVFIGNDEISNEQASKESDNDNLKIYLQTYALNNIDRFEQFSKALVAQTKSTNQALMSSLLLKDDSVMREETDEDSAAKNLMLIASVIATLLVMLIVFTAILVTIILRMKRRCKQLNSGKSIPMMKSKKMDKQLKQNLEKCQQQIDQIELSVRSKCAQLFQQLHHDYLNELNHDMIYTLGLPVWNYKTYLLNMLFPVQSNSSSSLLIETNPNKGQNMTCSSMSNSTTNTLLSSTLTPTQKQQQTNSTMSVYATIKSNNMLMQFNDNSSLQQTSTNLTGANSTQFSANVTEAMQLFDQLLHNKSFLLTFIQVCETSHSFQEKDRCNLASLLTMGLRNNLPYFYSIIKVLLSDFLANSFDSPEKSKKGLFCSNERIIEPLLTNWLAIFMHDFQKDTQCATHLFRLSKAMKFYLDMAPCDQQTQQACHSLSEDKLLREPVQFSVIYVNVVNQCHPQTNNHNQANSVQICRVLDMDTVQQAKEKILEHLYKNNSSLKPASLNVDLELCLILLNSNNNSIDANTLNSLSKQQHTTTLITLKETEEELIGNTGSNNVDLQLPKRLLTLKDYNIQNGSFINLTFKAAYVQQQQQIQQNQHVYMSTLSMNNEYQVYAAGERTDYKVPNPPQLPIFHANRYHIVKSQNVHSSYDSTSGSSASTSESQISSLSSESNKKRQKDSKKKKQYEKLLTVKSHDSAATGTTTTTSLLLNDTSSQGTSNYASGLTPSPLTRLLVNKGTIQPFIDQFMEALFMNTSNLPPVVQHLFEFFDQEAKKYQHHFMSSKSPSEELKNLSRSWKTNTYFIRYWANLIKNPDLLLEFEKKPLIDSSLTCIAQAFVDSCSNNDMSSLIQSETPINRLLFMRDKSKYSQMIDNFFNEMSSYQSISDHELHFYLNEFGKFQQHTQSTQGLGATIGGNNAPSTLAPTRAEVTPIQILLQLYQYYEKFEQPINALLGQQQCSVLLPLHHRLVQIKELLNNQISATTLNRINLVNPQQFNGNTLPYSANTLNPYQQPVNCYATSNDITNFQHGQSNTSTFMNK